jgi:predicted lactoylglutathione lyase
MSARREAGDIIETGSAPARKLFVNLPVSDLRRSMQFFSRLGFAPDPRFTDDRAACMVIGDACFVVLLTEAFFRSFARKSPCDAHRHAEALFVLSCRSRDEVDALAAEVVAAGGTVAEPIDHGFLYASRVQDLDGHQWELRWSDPEPVQA